PLWDSLLPWMSEWLQGNYNSATAVFRFKPGELTETFSGSLAIYSTMYDLFVENGNPIVEWDIILAAEFKPEEREKVERFLEKCLSEVPGNARKSNVSYAGRDVFHIEYY